MMDIYIYISCHLTRHRKTKKKTVVLSHKVCSSLFFCTPVALDQFFFSSVVQDFPPQQTTPSEVFGVFGVCYFHLAYIEITAIYKHPSRPKIPKPNLEYIEYVLEYGIPEISILYIVYILLVQCSIHAIRYNRYK